MNDVVSPASATRPGVRDLDPSTAPSPPATPSTPVPGSDRAPQCAGTRRQAGGASRYGDIVAIEKDPVTFTSGVTRAFVPGAFARGLRGLPVAFVPESARP